MPGHKLGKGIPKSFLENLPLLDLTEIPGTDNLHFPEGAIHEAQELAAAAFHADKTFFLVNGSTTGIHAAIMSVCKPGDVLIAARNCHKSVINGMMIAGVSPVYIKPQFNGCFGIPGAVEPNRVKEALEQNPGAAGVLVTSPTYHGICSDIKGIAKIVHSFGKILIVDEAHGAHLNFHDSLPPCAMDSGADICVQSAHKTLPALTQGAYLHINSGRVDVEKIASNLRLLQTSSPSYIIMAFLDIARAIMGRDGKVLLEKLFDNIGWFKRMVKSIGAGSGVSILNDEDIKEGRLDWTRIVVNFKNAGITGFEADKALRREYNIQVEMSDFYNIVCIGTVADRRENFEKLYGALSRIVPRLGSFRPLAQMPVKDPGIPKQAIELKDVMHRSGKMLKLSEAPGLVSKEMIVPYPPGIPVICPGEIVTGAAIEYIQGIINYGGVVNGLVNNEEICVVV